MPVWLLICQICEGKEINWKGLWPVMFHCILMHGTLENKGDSFWCRKWCMYGSTCIPSPIPSFQNTLTPFLLFVSALLPDCGPVHIIWYINLSKLINKNVHGMLANYLWHCIGGYKEHWHSYGTSHINEFLKLQMKTIHHWESMILSWES